MASRFMYVLQVNTGSENKIKDSISRGFTVVEAYVPQRIIKERKEGKWKEETKILFMGYVFIELQGQMTEEQYYYLSGIAGVLKILRGAAPFPQPMQENEMDLIRKLAWNGEPLGISKAYKDGESIKVIDGPLKGLEGNIIKVIARNFRAKVSISFLGEERVIELGIDMIDKK